MSSYRTVEGDRLDTIAFKVYGSTNSEIMEALLEANRELLFSAELEANSIVYLPEIKTSQGITTSKALW